VSVEKTGRGPSIALLVLAALLGGWTFGILQETQDQSLVFFAGFLALAMALAALVSVLRPGGDAGFRQALKAVPLLVAAVLALSFGDFTAYALEIDFRTLDNYGSSMSWQADLAVTLTMAAIYGVLLGLVAALAAYILRRAVVRAGEA